MISLNHIFISGAGASGSVFRLWRCGEVWGGVVLPLARERIKLALGSIDRIKGFQIYSKIFTDIFYPQTETIVWPGQNKISVGNSTLQDKSAAAAILKGSETMPLCWDFLDRDISPCKQNPWSSQSWEPEWQFVSCSSRHAAASLLDIKDFLIESSRKPLCFHLLRGLSKAKHILGQSAI